MGERLKGLLKIVVGILVVWAFIAWLVDGVGPPKGPTCDEVIRRAYLNSRTGQPTSAGDDAFVEKCGREIQEDRDSEAPG